MQQHTGCRFCSCSTLCSTRHRMHHFGNHAKLCRTQLKKISEGKLCLVSIIVIKIHFIPFRNKEINAAWPHLGMQPLPSDRCHCHMRGVDGHLKIRFLCSGLCAVHVDLRHTYERHDQNSTFIGVNDEPFQPFLTNWSPVCCAAVGRSNRRSAFSSIVRNSHFASVLLIFAHVSKFLDMAVLVIKLLAISSLYHVSS